MDRLADVLTAAERRELQLQARDLLERMTRQLAAHPGLEAPQPVVRPGDADDEYRLRRDRLRRVRAAQLAGALVNEVTAEFAAEEAADAVWLGASLADLGTTSGSTRQAARKRWPELGPIYRTRRWLDGHHDHLVAVIGAVLARAGELRGVGLDHLQPLRDALDNDEPQPARWRRLAEAVDRHLRYVADVAVPTTDEAAMAVDGARGAVAHFDADTAGPTR
ncbi:hypothetical protein HC028_14110 [Planosporangium flavigriseum]|uniref:Uncharacterized protein n=1 Tax=Planosporangium flavigriseum TaxID=373681 RepID=A0A8J3PP88_9ACTN|nr:hypothetical protein [Planosporangium flavigriseum]NJC65623.1 hypothetical protein [Planosporangium flavigriseum]GIG74786.1 hypothetical protein Pfl04_31900 [Planosporangium flavigriseum]